jgi:hypothetical protein
VTQREGGALDPQGPVSGAMADLFWLMLGLGAVVFVVVVVVLALGLLRRGRQGEPQADRQRPDRSGRWFVVGGVVAPLVILIIVFQGDGGRRWAELTGQAACQPPGDPRQRVAIVLDRQVISSP